MYEFQFDDSSNNHEILLRYNQFRDKLAGPISPQMILPLPAALSTNQLDPFPLPIPMTLLGPAMTPVSSKTLFRDLINLASGLTDSKEQVI